MRTVTCSNINEMRDTINKYNHMVNGISGIVETEKSKYFDTFIDGQLHLRYEEIK